MSEDVTASAGASARREYDRRRAVDESRTRDKWGRFGSIAVALTPERQSTRAWSTGALGEQIVGRRLDDVASADIRVLHDQRLPRSRANIDHIAVTPGGVWVIDSKRYVEKRPELRVDGGILRPRVEMLFVGGRNRTALVGGVLDQMTKVREAVGDAVPIRGALCFVDAEWPFFADPFTVGDVHVLWPKKLTEKLTRDREPVIDVKQTHARITERFRSA